jgi:hypothetical protein
MGSQGGLRLLEEARELVSQGWCRGADARDEAGKAVEPWHDAAQSWSILGALVAVLEREAATAGELPLEQLAAALYAVADVIHVESLEAWNDAVSRSQKDAVDALDRAARAYDAAYPHVRAS